MKSQSQNISSVKSTTLSLKLLNTVCPSQNNQFKRSISTFQQLSNRLTMANKNYKNNKFDHESAKQWFYDKGVNLNNVQIIAKQIKRQQKVQKKSKVEKISWQGFQYDKFSNLDLQQFLQLSQQRTAHFSIMKSFSTNNASNHMDRLRIACLKSTSDKKGIHLSKEQQKSRDITEKQIISQLITNYKQSLESDDQQESSMHKVIQKVIGLERFAWFRVLYYQIQMLQYLTNQYEVNKRNYILTTSLKELQKQAKQQPEDVKDFWKSVFLEYKRGGINFRHTDNDFDLQLLEGLKAIQHQANHFEDLSNERSIDISKKDNLYHRILKLIVLGTYDKALQFQNQVEQAWMIILSVALNRPSKSEQQQKIILKSTVEQFISKYDKTSLKKDQLLDQRLTALVSLGAHREILKIYRQLNGSNSLSPINRILFIQIFILLVSNVELIKSFNTQQSSIRGLPKSTSSLIKELLIQISHYTASFKSNNSNFYYILLTIIAEILRNLQQFQQQFEGLPKQITKILKLTINDLQQRDFSYLAALSQHSKLVKSIFQYVLLNTQLQSNHDYLRLADLCSLFKAQDLIEPILLKFVIVSQLQPKKDGFTMDENQQIMQEILDKLTEITTTQNNYIFHFLISLIQLKELVKRNNTEELTAKKKGFEVYLSNQRLISLLRNFCQDQEQRLLDIYISYYQQIYGMYKLIYLASNSMTQLRKKCSELVTQLEKLQKQYPILKSPKLGKLITQLKR